MTATERQPLRLDDGVPVISPTEDLARAIARFIAEAPASDPWAKFPPVLAVRHVAEVLGIHPRSVSEACRRGNLPMVKRLGRYVIDQVAFRAWLSGGGSA